MSGGTDGLEWTIAIEGTILTIFRTGLMSVTFRPEPVEAVVRLAVQSGLGRIAWSGDVHVPAGEFKAADRTRQLCLSAGVAIESYGSYWKAEGPGLEEFFTVLETAVRLQAPRIRVWAGSRASGNVNDADRSRIAEQLARAADMAAGCGISLHMEFHLNTLTDTAASATDLLMRVASLRAVDGFPLHSYWQPRPGVSDAAALAELHVLEGKMCAFHVFSWDSSARRLPLAAHRQSWLERLSAVEIMGAPQFDLMLEFVANGSPEQLREDAGELHRWLGHFDQH